MPHPSHNSWLDHSNTWRSVRVMNDSESIAHSSHTSQTLSIIANSE
jgi:hypothetical protein